MKHIVVCRVDPCVADRWLQGCAVPPGPGFTEVSRRRVYRRRRTGSRWILGLCISLLLIILAETLFASEALHVIASRLP
jgi:threonine/homoserine/homoserine lactone efflux protein